MKKIYLVHIYEDWFEHETMSTVKSTIHACTSKELAIKYAKDYVDNCISDVKRENGGELPEGVSINDDVKTEALLSGFITYLIDKNDHNTEYSIGIQEIELFED